MLFQPRLLPAFERHAELTESERVDWEEWVAPKLSRFEPTVLSRLGCHRAMLAKYHKLQPKLETKLKVAMQIMRQEHVN